MKFKEVFVDLLIEKNNGSQTNLSRETGIPIPTINGWLTKDKNPRAEQLITLSKYYNVTVDYLLGLDERAASKSPFRANNIDISLPRTTKYTEKTKILKGLMQTLSVMSLAELKIIYSFLSLVRSKEDVLLAAEKNEESENEQAE